ncbi:hypothetical protein C8A05DRAFT_44349 [Staphylotrichum tortipilum]|uniref:Uncharacterized protein n=1 Tax=Staphylotrichum tortipilum TaxID=2831512 RepID=A0AAN6RSV1_9PEZI|nr:hypothetical protein C8A05DRAFT_44349 [Staphylotrichum longicolle]
MDDALTATATRPPTAPLFLSPALPSDLLHYVINHCSYPTTLLVCSGRAEFLSSLAQDLLAQRQRSEQQEEQQQEPYRTASEPHDTTSQRATTAAPPPPPPPGGEATTLEAYHPGPLGNPSPPDAEPPPQPQPPPPQHPLPHGQHHPLLTPSLAQLAATRHIRTVFVPTVSHLRAWLAVFSVDDHHFAPPPPLGTATKAPIAGSSRLVVYNLLALHRHTSEWSAQGLGASVAGLVEAGRRAGRVVVVEEGALAGGLGLKEILGEGVPVLGGRAGGADLEGWKGRTVEVGRVLARWFRFGEGRWWEGG